MKLTKYSTLAAMIGVLAVLGAGPAQAAPSSVQRDGGPCYVHEYGTRSADGLLACSAETGSWKSMALSRAPKVRIDTACPQLGARAYVFRTDGIATCRESANGLRWQW